MDHTAAEATEKQGGEATTGGKGEEEEGAKEAMAEDPEHESVGREITICMNNPLE